MILHSQKYWRNGAVSIRVINHFSHNGEMTHEQLETFAKENGMIAAYDGMKVLF